MMITRISAPVAYTKSIQANSTPAFGFAKLNETGRETADTFGYENHEFLNENLFKKQGFFAKSALASELRNGADFMTLCTDYGCTKNGKANAEFIRTQILSKKSNSAIANLDDATRTNALKTLLFANYDNPELTKKETDDLLEIVRDSIENTEYVKLAGLIKVGADR